MPARARFARCTPPSSIDGTGTATTVTRRATASTWGRSSSRMPRREALGVVEVGQRLARAAREGVGLEQHRRPRPAGRRSRRGPPRRRPRRASRRGRGRAAAAAPGSGSGPAWPRRVAPGPVASSARTVTVAARSARAPSRGRRPAHADALERPQRRHDDALDVVDRHRAELARVAADGAVVAHHEERHVVDAHRAERDRARRGVRVSSGNTQPSARVTPSETSGRFVQR